MGATQTPGRHTAIAMRYAFAPANAAVWKDAPRKGLRIRDLNLAAASGGQLSAVVLRADGAGVIDRWRGVESCTFRFVYLLSGEVTFDLPLDEQVHLGKGDVVHLPFLAAASNARYSSDFAAVDISAPALASRSVKPAPLLQIRAKPHIGNWENAVSREREDAYRKGEGPRKYFLYRDLGTSALTGRRIHIHIVRAVESMAGGTGWHDHTMSQLFMVLRGEAVISVDGHGESRVEAGDAMTIGAGMRHDVSSFSPDYLVLEMCLPAEYDTTGRSAPEL